MFGHQYQSKNITEAIEQLQSFNIHQNKLDKLKKDLVDRKTKKNVIDNEAEYMKSKIFTNRIKTNEFRENEKISAIKKDNQHLLDRLMEISRGKKNKVIQKGPRSLNYIKMKRDAEKIDIENQKLLHRIITQPAALSKKQFDAEYERNKQYKNQLQRRHKTNVHNLIAKGKQKLPPLKVKPYSKKPLSKPDTSKHSTTGKDSIVSRNTAEQFPYRPGEEEDAIDHLQMSEKKDGDKMRNLGSDFHKRDGRLSTGKRHTTPHSQNPSGQKDKSGLKASSSKKKLPPPYETSKNIKLNNPSIGKQKITHKSIPPQPKPLSEKEKSKTTGIGGQGSNSFVGTQPSKETLKKTGSTAETEEKKKREEEKRKTDMRNKKLLEDKRLREQQREKEKEKEKEKKQQFNTPKKSTGKLKEEKKDFTHKQQPVPQQKPKPIITSPQNKQQNKEQTEEVAEEEVGEEIEPVQQPVKENEVPEEEEPDYEEEDFEIEEEDQAVKTKSPKKSAQKESPEIKDDLEASFGQKQASHKSLSQKEPIEEERDSQPLPKEKESQSIQETENKEKKEKSLVHESEEMEEEGFEKSDVLEDKFSIQESPIIKKDPSKEKTLTQQTPTHSTPKLPTIQSVEKIEKKDQPEKTTKEEPELHKISKKESKESKEMAEMKESNEKKERKEESSEKKESKIGFEEKENKDLYVNKDKESEGNYEESFEEDISRIKGEGKQAPSKPESVHTAKEESVHDEKPKTEEREEEERKKTEIEGEREKEDEIKGKEESEGKGENVDVNVDVEDVDEGVDEGVEEGVDEGVEEGVDEGVDDEGGRIKEKEEKKDEEATPMEQKIEDGGRESVQSQHDTPQQPQVSDSQHTQQERVSD